ncbi:MAG TPA: PCYCGC motif-containing (lipo)protein [Syntrophorhabdales bacterium]|nr:PCYCGC motif-containing (lipo)protein [Syntrophorhabdales bacterium]
MKTLASLLVCLSLLLLFPHPRIAFSADPQKEFEAIGRMKGPELVARAKALLEKKYPKEDWEKYHFPNYVYLKEQATISYKIAVKESDLLSKFHCYCFCETYLGHKNLSWCSLKGGKLSNGFEPHGAGCNTCHFESMTAFLWNDLGIDLPRMQEAMKRIYEHEQPK